jgi:hypothetical protein
MAAATPKQSTSLGSTAITGILKQNPALPFIDVRAKAD